MNVLRAELVNHVASPEGPQADILLIEPNGDKHLVRCLVKESGTDLGADGEILSYLNDRYGPSAVVQSARSATLKQ